MKRVVHAFEEVPWFYGFAYRDFSANATICYPIPINWIVAITRWIIFRLQRPPRGKFDKKLRDVYYLGWETGYAAGFERQLSDKIQNIKKH